MLYTNNEIQAHLMICIESLNIYVVFDLLHNLNILFTVIN